jgi:hypothetical protein
MPIAPTNGNTANGIAFLIGAGFVAEAVAKACSSPQTVEINVKKRAETLMKWVNVGMIEGVAMVLIAATFDRKHSKAIVLGGLLEAIITYVEYWHGKSSGLAKQGPATEEY